MQFDPLQYMDMETTEEAKKRPPLPVGDYRAQIGEPSIKPWANDEGKSGLQVLIPVEFQIPDNIKTELGYTKGTLTLTDRVFLDLNEGGAIDWTPGMNRRLRQYRIATGMNKAGEAFSLRRLQGRPITAQMQHEMYKGEVQERIGGIAAAS